MDNNVSTRLAHNPYTRINYYYGQIKEKIIETIKFSNREEIIIIELKLRKKKKVGRKKMGGKRKIKVHSTTASKHAYIAKSSIKYAYI